MYSRVSNKRTGARNKHAGWKLFDINKRAGCNKAVQVGIFQKIIVNIIQKQKNFKN